MSLLRVNYPCKADLSDSARYSTMPRGRDRDGLRPSGSWLLAIAVSWCTLAGPSNAMGFNLIIAFDGGLTASQQAVFTEAENFWSSQINGYLPGIVQNSVVIQAKGMNIDGEGMIFGQAGPTQTTLQGGYRITVSGRMFFDTADLANLEATGRFGEVIEHEMGHVLGLGTLWTSNGVYNHGTGQYTGAKGLAAYRTEFNQPTATFIPVELGGAAGTSNAHWDEVDKDDVNGGNELTGITDPLGRDMRHELMTGWLNSPTFVSRMSVQSLGDIGFDVVPEPGSRALLIGALILVWGSARQACRSLVKRRNDQSHADLRDSRRPKCC